ncbi:MULTISPECIES: N-acetylmannosamine-6-phosphate 2-epimerase [Corynebacterium]|uniref:N-acetylmannosamine-6-phosphate 2-epimerase n=1 Tax=Corynebacterium TaxID=1716 RepID=UPI00019C20A0|nr:MULTISPECIES: N-acetylmannosamine-6-phosphate 2-epimerase [Corynebacterium]EEI27136.1 putative N-acetylmannosamine-6-phosphate epimerase [Corynebacterium glucuronolyticum ATCC 51867]MCT1442092.1 N-acetylmannosamine-6-phosphate 2-epimerase [Corynebacterium glucuronolyticum]MCT1564326.1 N-acetylmannosamine-6-phosphate 2-epimerase [Corynebacterium glucuronolyticum]OFO48014.1 N-acetylmannosamine-6-phosphate 2-epimerase [Corynebacterium sp. HMSC073D01]QRO82701.1 N-acetylmannosamine-6-phosphate 2
MKFSDLQGKLVVSCQAYPGEPMRHPDTMAQVAEAVVEGGAAGVRLQGLEDIKEARTRVDVPIIGLVKEGYEGVYITPTLELCIAVADAGADVVALDATTRPRPDGLTFPETVRKLREARPDVLIMADCDCMESARQAVDAGVDVISTTLAGYTEARPKTEGPDLELLREMHDTYPDVPLICEGRIHSGADAKAALDAGADTIVVGTAITHPTSITSWFVEAIS